MNLLSIRLSWSTIIAKFNAKYDEVYLCRYAKAHLDFNEQIIEGAKERWRIVLLLDAIVCDIREQDVNYHSPRELNPTSRPNRRQFDQHKVLASAVRECLHSELEINPIFITSSCSAISSLRSESTDSRDQPPLLKSISLDSWSSCASNASSCTDDYSEETTHPVIESEVSTKSTVILHPTEVSDAEVTLHLTFIPLEWTTSSLLAEHVATSAAVSKSHQRRQQLVKDMLSYKGFEGVQMGDVVLSYVAAIVKGELADHSHHQTTSRSTRISPTNFRGAQSASRPVHSRLDVIPEDPLVGSEVDSVQTVPPLSRAAQIPGLISTSTSSTAHTTSSIDRSTSIEHLTVRTSPRNRLTVSGSVSLSSVSLDSTVSGGETDPQNDNSSGGMKKRKQSPTTTSTNTTAEKRISPNKSPEKVLKSIPPSPPTKNDEDESGQISTPMEVSTPSPPQQSTWSSALISAALMLEESAHNGENK